MTTWADIQRLASDLQRVQLSQSAKKLSEANCVEVVSKLISHSLIDVVFTRDGHCYVTKKHLHTEVRNECLGNAGRVALTDIATALNVDFDHVDRTAREIVASDDEFTLSSGELFCRDYVNRLLSDLRTLLADTGYRTVSFLCKHWDLSQELLQTLLLKQLPADFDGVLDGDTLYTNSYLNSRRNVLRAVLSAITKPTQFSTIISRVGMSSQRFWAAFDQLSQSGEVAGRVNGARTSPSCTFVPLLHDRLVEICIKGLYQQNEFLQFSQLKKLGVSEKPSDVAELLSVKTADLHVLPTMLIAKSLYDECIFLITAEVDKSGIAAVREILSLTSAPFEDGDIEALSEVVVAKKKNLLIAADYVFSDSLLTRAVEGVADDIEKKAQEEMDRLEKEKKKGGGQAQQQQQQKKAAAADDDDDWGDNKKGKGKKGKGGGGAAPNAKGKGKASDDADASGAGGKLARVSEETVEEWLRKAAIVPEEIADAVAAKILNEVESKLHARVAHLSATQLNASAQSQKKQLASAQAQAQSLYNSFGTFETASSAFVEPLGSSLRQYLLKSVGGELANAVLSYASGTDHAELMKDKQREETIAALPGPSKDAVSSLFASLKSDSLDAFHTAIFDVSASAACGLALRKPDKQMRIAKSEEYATELKQQVAVQADPAALLLSAVLYLLAKNDRPVTASGKFVAQLVPLLADFVPEETLELLKSCQRSVVACIKNKGDDVAKEMLDADIAKLKALIL